MIASAADIRQLKTQHGFIVVEGVNGAGKTTQLAEIEKLLREQKQDFLLTKEPGASPYVGQNLRKLLLDRREPISELTELYLFCADRNHHINQIIKPALAQDKLVISDRYYYSTLAFQGAGRKLPSELIQQIHQPCLEQLYPDLVILYDIPAEDGLRRNQSVNLADGDYFESETLAFHQSVRQQFLILAEMLPEQFVVIDGSEDLNTVTSRTREVLMSYLANR